MRKSDGFTLPEVMISMTITLIVVGISLQAFVDGMRLANATRVVSETNHGLQATMSLLSRDFIQAGQGIPTGGVPIPSGAGVAPIIRPGPPGAGLTFPIAWTVLPALAPGGSLGPTMLGIQTDIVMMLYADATLALNEFPLDAIAPDGSNMAVNIGTTLSGPNGIKIGDLIMFSNAQGNAVQMVTGTNGAQIVYFTATDPLNINQRAAAQGTIMNLQSSPGIFPPTTATRIFMISYYIDAVTDPQLPRIVRQINSGQRLAVGLGVENLQFTYDFIDGVANPTNVEMPPVGNSAHQIRKANVYVAARSLELNTQTHQFFRNSMATEVGLRSLSFVDRYR